MPQPVALRSLLTPLHRQVANTLAALEHEIARRETELADLKAALARWRQAANRRVGLARRRAPRRPRVDWTTLLQGLPARFTTKEVAAKTGKPLPQGYAGIWRWVKEKKVAKDKTGSRKLCPARS
jgi:hypothetical protein